MSKKGFTLVELLVTVSIIAILVAVGMVTYSSVIKQGRDSKRQSDLRSIQSVLEQYYSDQLFYPSGDLPWNNSLTNAAGNPNTVSQSKTYLKITPSDPLGTPNYAYVAYSNVTVGAGCNNTNPKCSTYCLYAKLENLAAAKLNGCPTHATGQYNFAVSSP